MPRSGRRGSGWSREAKTRVRGQKEGLWIMHCKTDQKSIYLLLDRELDSQRAEALRSHLGICLSCQRQAEAMRAFDELLRTQTAREPLPAGFEAAFWRRARQDSTTPVREPFWRAWEEWLSSVTLSQALVAALMAFVFGGATGALSFFGSAPASGHQLSRFYALHGASSFVRAEPFDFAQEGSGRTVERGAL